MQQNNKRKLGEKGFASIVIALILIIVLALLTVGFARLARHEQQNALNKQLALQAKDAAESGLNDAYQDILSGQLNSSNTSSTTCMTPGGATYGTRSLPNTALTAGQAIDGNHDVSYTCMLVDLTPTDLQFDSNSSGNGVHATFSTVGGALNQMTISWGSSGQGYNHYPSTTATQFPPVGSWNDGNSDHPYPPVIAFSLTPLNSVDRDALTNNTFTVYLYPASTAGGGSNCNQNVNGTTVVSQCIGVSSGNGQIVSGKCQNSVANGKYPCHVTITGLNGTDYLLHYVDFYTPPPPSVLITGTQGSTQLRFSGEPAIDVTGKAKNVLKRLRGRYLVSPNNGSVSNAAVLPNQAIEAENLCKRFGTAPSTADNPNGTNFPDAESVCHLDR